MYVEPSSFRRRNRSNFTGFLRAAHVQRPTYRAPEFTLSCKLGLTSWTRHECCPNIDTRCSRYNSSRTSVPPFLFLIPLSSLLSHPPPRPCSLHPASEIAAPFQRGEFRRWAYRDTNVSRLTTTRLPAGVYLRRKENTLRSLQRRNVLPATLTARDVT